MKKIVIVAAVFLTGCTLSMNMVHTQGQADDVVDETQSPSTTANPNISVPVNGI